MLTEPQTASVRFINYILSLGPRQFSGRLDVLNSQDYQWSIYFDEGRIEWATGGVHPWRRWRRNLIAFCPDLPRTTWSQPQLNIVSPRYEILNYLVEQAKITSEQAVNIAEGIVQEVLFDLMQQQEMEERQEKTLMYICEADEFQESFWQLSIYQLLQKVQTQWEAWRKADLLMYSPDLSLVIKAPQQLQSALPSNFYQKLQSASKKKLTLRDLATYFKTDLLKLTLSLLPYIRGDKIALVAVPDLLAPHLNTSENGQEVPTVQSLLPSFVVEHAPVRQIFVPPVLTQLQITPNTREPSDDRPLIPSITSPLIICVDNCPDTQKTVERTVTNAGYRYIGIKDSMLALPTIMEKKPDMILLNLFMPVVNGDEICTQIRRSDLFKQTPVFLLTEKEGLVDRIRAKMSGNTDFIGKPIHSGKLLEIVKKYLGKPVS